MRKIVKYSVVKYKAKQFANEINQTIYIVKSPKINDYIILFEEKEIEKYKNHKLYETVNPK